MSVHADTDTGLRQQVHDAARRARVASRVLATLTTQAKNRALHAAADAVLAAAHEVEVQRLWQLVGLDGAAGRTQRLRGDQSTEQGPAPVLRSAAAR